MLQFGETEYCVERKIPLFSIVCYHLTIKFLKPLCITHTIGAIKNNPDTVCCCRHFIWLFFALFLRFIPQAEKMKKSAQTTIQRMALFALDIIDVVLLHFLFVFFLLSDFSFCFFFNSFGMLSISMCIGYKPTNTTMLFCFCHFFSLASSGWKIK